MGFGQARQQCLPDMARVFLLIVKHACSCAIDVCNQTDATSAGLSKPCACQQGAALRWPQAVHAVQWSCREHLQDIKTYAAVS